MSQVYLRHIRPQIPQNTLELGYIQATWAIFRLSLGYLAIFGLPGHVWASGTLRLGLGDPEPRPLRPKNQASEIP